MRLLIVDDDEDNLLVESALFERAGAEVVAASSGPAAIEQVMQHEKSGRPFDLVLLDIHMPGISGHQVAKEMRNIGYKGTIAALTAAASEEGKRESQLAGIDAYFGKSTLTKEVAELLVQEYSGKSHE